MAVFDNEGDSKQALLNDLKSLHSMLEEDAKTTIHKDTASKPEPGDPTAVKIPLLQDIFDPEHPDQEIQIEQLKVDHVEQWVTGNLFEETVDPVAGQTTDQPDLLVSVPGEPVAGEEPDESIDYAPGTKESSTELTALYAEYASQWGEPEIAGTGTVSKSIAGLAPAEADEFLELLVEEHADEILDLLKDILKDRLSLLVTQVRDSDSTSGFTDNDDLAGDLPPGIFSED